MQRGFTLIESIIGVALLLIVFLGIFGVYQLGFRVISQSKSRITAIALANQKIEFARNLSYNDVGTISGIPSGSIPQTDVIVRNGISYTVNTTIIFIDDPFDGVAPIDTVPNDYKRIKVKASWSNQFSGEVLLMSDVSPKGLETSLGGGNIKITVFDALGAVVPQADIHVVNNITVPTIDTNYQTNNDGQILIAGAPESITGYEVTVTKPGYSTERTYSTAEVANPSNPHLTVLEGKLTQASFSIDLLGSFAIDSIWLRNDVYFVRKSGDDLADGLSAGTAFATIGKAASVMKSGDMVYVGAGTYSETVIPARSGIIGFPISFFADVAGEATGDIGSVVLDGGNTLCYAFDLSSGFDYIVIDGFEATNYRQCNTGDATFLFSGSGGNINNNNIYRNLIAHDTRRDGIAFGGNNNTLENCLVYNTGDDSLELGASAIVVSGNKVQNCTLSGNIGIDTGAGGHAIEFSPATDGTNILENNIIDGNLGWIDSYWSDEIWNYNDWTNGSLPGIGNASIDPLFITASPDNYHLSQIAAGQLIDSPVVDAGSDTAIALGFDTLSTRTDDVNDVGQLDMGFHFGFAPPSPPAPSPPPVIPNTQFHLRGSKIIGTDINDNSVYKYDQDHTTDAGGHIDLSNMEWDSYTFTVDPITGLDLVDTNPTPQPIGLLPGVNQGVILSLEAENGLAIVVKDEDSLTEIFSVNVRIFNVGLGYDETYVTNSVGEVFFVPLENATYSYEAQASGYENSSGNISVSGDTNHTILLTPEEI